MTARKMRCYVRCVILRKDIALARTLRPILRLIAILLYVALFDASWSTPAKMTDRTSLAGQLLVSSPSIADPHFDHTVIFLVQHDQKGAFGIAQFAVGGTPAGKSS